jgi:hypothetical protein
LSDTEPPAPSEPQDLVSIVRSPGAPRDLRVFAARGLLPLERDDRLRAVLAVVGDEDPDVGPPARETFATLPPDDIVRFLEAASPTGEELDAISRLSEDHFVLERIIRHPDASDETLLRLASSVSGDPQEALVVNQVRLLRTPALIVALLENPGLTADGRRRLAELREEFFEKEARRQERERLRQEEEGRRAREEAEGIVFEEATGEDGAGEVEPEGHGGPVDEVAEAGLAAIYRRISMMTVKEKVELAQRGTKEERRILIADANKMVSMAVLTCESISQAEVEAFCSMRHLSAEIFQEVASTREWIKKPRIQRALVTNPAVPLSITLPLVKYLSMRELRTIGRDRNLPEGIRLAARKIIVEKRG